MSLAVATDYFGLVDSALVLVSSTENRSAQNVEALDQRGDIISRDIFGEAFAPSCEYKLAADLSKAISLGTVSTVGTEKVVLNKLSIKTSAGAEPQISASGESIQDAGTASSTVALGTVTCSVRHKAQILGSAFTLSGTGCALNECSIDFEATISKATKAGEVLAHDVHGGKATVTATIIQSGATKPTITAGTDWDITSPLTESDPDSNVASWSVTLTKSFAGTDPV